jgi:glycosyltransferase involved in cell wall biosynthesis
MARISIITRTFDRPVLLARMFRSLEAQTFADWECIVVNGGSTASVQQAMAGLNVDTRTRVINYSGPKGMRGVSLNQGVAASQSPLVTVLDDDDTWQPDFLKKMIHFLEQNAATGAKGVICQSTRINEKSVEEGLEEIPQDKGREVYGADLRQATLARLAIQNCWCIHAFIYERSAFDAVGGYSATLPVLEDWEFNLRFLLQHDVLVLQQPLANYHHRPTVKQGAEANSQYGELDLHLFYDGKVRNDALRADLASGRSGLGALLASAAQALWLERHVHRLEGRVRAASDKIGRIDNRTQEMKKG